MGELLNIGITPESIDFSIDPKEDLIASYQDQVVAASSEAWGDYWPLRISEGVRKSDLLSHIATTTAKVVSILGIDKPPSLGLLNGFNEGKTNYQGYCWVDDDGQTWVGLNELWFGDIAEEAAESGRNISPTLRDQISFILAEEVFHAYIREVNSALDEETVLANASGDPEKYWNNPGERAAKEFAVLYVKQSNN